MLKYLLALVLFSSVGFALTPSQINTLNNIANITNTSNSTLISIFTDFENSNLNISANFTNFYNINQSDSIYTNKTFISDTFYNKTEVNNNLSGVFYDKNSIDMRFYNKTTVNDNISQVYYAINIVNGSVNLEIVRLISSFSANASANATQNAKDYVNSITQSIGNIYLTKEDAQRMNLNMTAEILTSVNNMTSDMRTQVYYAVKDSKDSSIVLFFVSFIIIIVGDIAMYFFIMRKREVPALPKGTLKMFKKRSVKGFSLNDANYNDDFKKNIEEQRNMEEKIYAQKVSIKEKRELLKMFREGRIETDEDLAKEVRLSKEHDKLDKG